MENLSFLKQYVRKPKTVGAIFPSSKYLAKKMVEDIDFDRAECIVEYGSGTGVFTKELIERRRENTVILIFEYNYKFYELLKEKFEDQRNLCIINDTAENVDKYLLRFNLDCADYIVSGLPFASLPRKVSERILEKTKKVLKKDGLFITFQYTLFKKGFISDFFNNIEIKRELRNIPPAYVFKCSNL